MLYVRLFSLDPVTVFMGFFMVFWAILLLVMHRVLHLRGVRLWYRKPRREKGSLRAAESAGPAESPEAGNGTSGLYARCEQVRGESARTGTGLYARCEQVRQKNSARLDQPVRRRLGIWRFLCFIPLVVAVIHFRSCRFVNMLPYTLKQYGGLYVAALIMAGWAFFGGHRKAYRRYSVSAVIGVAACFLYTFIIPLSYDSAMRNYSHDSYTKAFISTVEDMKKYYSLTDWKKADFDGLRDELLPVIAQADHYQDEGLYYAAVLSFTHHLYDGHARAWPITDTAWYNGLFILAGYDFGLSMVKLDDGRVIAVAVEPTTEDFANPAYNAGIRAGMEIISWNGLQINEALKQVDCVYQNMTWPVASNEDVLKPAFLATKALPLDGGIGIGSLESQLMRVAAELRGYESVHEAAENIHADALVGFRDEAGKVREVRLKAVEWGIDRLESVCLGLFCWLYESEFMKNTDVRMLTETTGYMMLYSEKYNDVFDMLSYMTGRYPAMKDVFINRIEELKAQGMTRLVIDARDNTGGFPAICCELAGLFSERSFPVAVIGSEIAGEVSPLKTDWVIADGRYSDVQVVLLTDAYCVSAGDYLVKVLSECPNVTVMGMTTSNCSCQAQGGRSFLSGVCSVGYPVNWMYNLDMTRFIDTDDSRQCTLPLDVKIPLDEAAVRELLYVPGSDYQLRYALEYLEPGAELPSFKIVDEGYSTWLQGFLGTY